MCHRLGIDELDVISVFLPKTRNATLAEFLFMLVHQFGLISSPVRDAKADSRAVFVAPGMLGTSLSRAKNHRARLLAHVTRSLAASTSLFAS